MNNCQVPAWFSDPQRLVRYHLDGDDVILFDRASGETHFLNELTALVLERITSEGTSLQRLLDALQEWSGTRLNADSVAKIEFALKALEESELVECRAVKLA